MNYFSNFERQLQYIDVAVINNPADATYFNLGNCIHQVGSDNDVHVSQNAIGDAINNQGSGDTAHRELAKKSKSCGLLGNKVDMMDYFVPFVVDATGRMGPAARELDSLQRF